jgi:hypothetical protein
MNELDSREDTITIQRSWFERLAKLAKEAEREVEGEKLPFGLTSVSKLIGYTLSAEVFLELFPNNKKDEN